MFSIQTKTKSRAVFNSSGLKGVFENLRFRDGLDWTVGLTTAKKLRRTAWALPNYACAYASVGAVLTSLRMRVLMPSEN